MGKYTLWCLNRVAAWNRRSLADALTVKHGWFNAMHSVRLGRRAAFDQDETWENRELDRDQRGGVLLHEAEERNEYFVPVPVKCVGDPNAFERRFGNRFTPAGRAAFRALRLEYARYFAGNEWRAYWSPRRAAVPSLGDVGMFTRADGPRPYAGLYELVAADAAESGTRAVLVGYSQGGLVARFLAWMDEMLIDPAHRAVAGVITVQAPNCGSPLASLRNAPNVAFGLFGLLSGLGGFSVVGDVSPHLARVLKAIVAGSGPPENWHFDIGTFCSILEAAMADPQGQGGKGDVLRTARKWLSGLVPIVDAATAFDDLNPAYLDRPQSVLGCLEAMPLVATLHGAIIGADTEFDDLALSGMSALRRFIVRHAVPTKWFDAAEAPYARIALDEGAAGAPQTALHTRIASLYQTGTSLPSCATELPPFAHDFVIPSVSQAMYALSPRSAPRVFLGNVVNPKGTHISGGTEDDPDSDKSALVSMLRELGRQLA